MIAYLADTDWMVDFLKGKEEAIQFFTSAADEGVAMSIVTYAELYEGLLTAGDNERRQLEDLIEVVNVVAADLETARTFAALRAGLRTRGELIPDHDLWIAATALRHDLALKSRDEHFDRIRDLRRS